MGLTSNKLQAAAALLSTLSLVSGQSNGTGPSAAGPTWDHSLFESSPPVYPSREQPDLTVDLDLRN